MDGLKPTVVWDVDDVLNDLMAAWLTQIWSPSHPDAAVAFADLRENPPHELLGIDLGEYLASLDRFRTGDGYAAQSPNSSILAWLEINGGRCHNVALTATSLRAAPASSAWVLRHFGRWIREFAFIPATRPGEELPVYDVDKGAWLARTATQTILVDDSPKNLADAAAAGAVGVCWPRPWNGSCATEAEALRSLTRLIDSGQTA